MHMHRRPAAADVVGTNVSTSARTASEFGPCRCFANVCSWTRSTAPREDAVRPARVHAGGHVTVDSTRTARAPVPRGGDQTGRVRGHLSAARGAARSLHGRGVARLPERAGGERHAARPRRARPLLDREPVTTWPEVLAAQAPPPLCTAAGAAPYVVAILDATRAVRGGSGRLAARRLMLFRAAKAMRPSTGATTRCRRRASARGLGAGAPLLLGPGSGGDERARRRARRLERVPAL